MPKETFFNLPDAKREAITAIAIEEFADHPYAVVSISRIVARAGIAKGSFYQYFEDKEDLYTYLLELIGEKKKEMFSIHHPDPEHVGVFKYLHWVVENSFRFELTYPELTRLGYRAFAASLLPQAFQSRVRQETIAFYRRLVALGQEQGDISREINPDLVASIFEVVFTSLNQTLMGYITEHVESEQSHQPLFVRPEILQLYHQAMDILERGLAPAPSFMENGARHPAPSLADQAASEEIVQ
jgi:AcrR family transcriptional regulator